MKRYFGLILDYKVGCYDWSEEFDYGDKLTVAILSKEITKFYRRILKHDKPAVSGLICRYS